LPCAHEARHNAGVEAAPQLEERRDDTPGTLGDVLYADKSKTQVPETDWVALVRRIAGGDQLALHALYERANRVVFTLIVRLTSDRETAEELTLDVFYDVWRRASLYDAANGTVLGWIMNQARSRAIDRVRFEHRKKRVDPYARDPLQAVDLHAPSVFEDEGRALRTALMVLTPEERQVIEAAFFGELTHAEVAVRLNQPLGTVKTRIRSALHKLRHALGGGIKES
jgi:RNA polymerase sigma-70 factor, ECF subfamily